ncbi:MAG: hypothetical protein ACRED4_07195 [Brevundimonas sp.]
MAEKTFSINTEPHVAIIGNERIEFLPEVVGTDFAEGYAALVEVQQKVNDAKAAKSSSTKHAKGPTMDPRMMLELNSGMRTFLSGLMMPESKERFAEMRLPDRILVNLLEWVAELYGGGSGKSADGGQSGD